MNTTPQIDTKTALLDYANPVPMILESAGFNNDEIGYGLVVLRAMRTLLVDENKFEYNATIKRGASIFRVSAEQESKVRDYVLKAWFGIDEDFNSVVVG